MNSYVKSVCEEYCKSVSVLEDESVEVVIEGQYFTELYARVMGHGYCCRSIMSSSHDDNHVVIFSPAGEFDMFDDFFGESPEDDSADWWRHQD